MSCERDFLGDETACFEFPASSARGSFRVDSINLEPDIYGISNACRRSGRRRSHFNLALHGLAKIWFRCWLLEGFGSPRQQRYTTTHTRDFVSPPIAKCRPE